jgi:hypothetical protein
MAALAVAALCTAGWRLHARPLERERPGHSRRGPDDVLAEFDRADPDVPAARHEAGRREARRESLKDPNPLTWTSSTSLVTTVYGIGTADGLNERGLAAHMLYLNAADFGARDKTVPGLDAGLCAVARRAQRLDLRRRCRSFPLRRTGTRRTSISRSRTRVVIPPSSRTLTARPSCIRVRRPGS